MDAVPRHAVQLYEALTYATIFVLLVLVYHRRGKASRQGVLLSLFLVSAFSARFLLEFLKTRQAAYESSQLLSVGQWLSIPFVVVGLIWLACLLTIRKNGNESSG